MIVGCHGDGLMNHLSAHSPLAPQRRADATAWPRATSPTIAARRTSLWFLAWSKRGRYFTCTL